MKKINRKMILFAKGRSALAKSIVSMRNFAKAFKSRTFGRGKK